MTLNYVWHNSHSTFSAQLPTNTRQTEIKFRPFHAYYVHSHAFSALTLLVEHQEGHPACKKTQWSGAGVVICLEWGADLHMAQLMPLPLTVSIKSRLVSPFWYRLTRVVPDKRLLNSCVCVCAYTIILCPLYRSICVSWQHKLRSNWRDVKHYSSFIP